MKTEDATGRARLFPTFPPFRMFAMTMRGRVVGGCGAALAVLALAAGLSAQLPAVPEVDRLIDELGNDEFARRESASAALRQWGELALPALRRALTSKSAEVVQRAGELVDDLERHASLGAWRGPAAIVCLDATPDGKRVVTGGTDKIVHVWDLPQGTRTTQSPHQGEIWAIALTRDGRRVLSGGQSGALLLWDLESDKLIRAFRATGNAIRCAAFLPDQTQAVTGGFDHLLRLWDLATGEELRRFIGHRDSVFSLAVSSDGSELLSGGGIHDNTARLWDIAQGRELRRFQGHTDRVFAVAFAAGDKVVTGSSDGTARTWDKTTGKELHRLMGHQGAVHSLAVTPDGRLLLTGGADGTLRLWDVATGQEWRQYPGHADGIYGVRVLADGGQALSAGTDKSLRRWQLPDLKKLAALERSIKRNSP